MDDLQLVRLQTASLLFGPVFLGRKAFLPFSSLNYYSILMVENFRMRISEEASHSDVLFSYALRSIYEYAIEIFLYSGYR
jgi:hypothetical protein